MEKLPRFFDIHAHVNDVAFDVDRNAVLSRMREKNIFAIMVGTDHKTSQGAAMMASFADSGVYASIGVHPIDDQGALFREPFFDDLVAFPRVVAVGECGLDYSRLSDTIDVPAEKARQRKLFEAQVDFATEKNLPLMIHCRDSDKALADAHRDIISILATKKKDNGEKVRGNIHFFAQNIDIAREYFALDFTISFTGVITFSREYDEVIRMAPLDRILSETDCPYVAPIPYRGKRNEPIYVEEIVKKIAEIRNEDFETVRAALVQNAIRVFNITPHI
ncbi:TatD family deoxyribonuclease [Patescibacteria group bacterium]|nr:MAG: TatD family deoxyribonuclease [Patescibacteria group bacterium]